MATWDVYGDWAYEGGAFAFGLNIYWGIQMATEQARLAGDVEAFDALYAASRALPLSGPTPCRPEVLEKYARYTHYGDWVGNPLRGPYWDSIGVGHALEGKPMDVPMLHFGGWYDFMLTGTLRMYREAVTRSTKPQRLIVGPWTHMPWGRRAGAVDFGEDAPGGIDRLQIVWFDRFLKGIENGVDRAPPVRLFDTLAKKWRDFDSWPEPAKRGYYTASDGLAATTEAGALSAKPPSRPGTDTIVHDPWRPVPSMGGHNADPDGMRERSEVDNRNDVLTYTTAPLTAPTTLAGDVELTLTVRADQPCFDISAILSCVTLEGRSFNLTQGHRRVENHDGGPLRIGMRALCASLESGDALRLSLAGASFPAFAVNPGTGAPQGEARQMDARVITLTVTSGGDHPTRLDLPVLTTKWTNAIGFNIESG
jgi:putative CocE/NonD family hydrolase